MRKSPLEHECEFCGNFFLNKHRRMFQRFCSQPCAAKFSKMPIEHHRTKGREWNWRHGINRPMESFRARQANARLAKRLIAAHHRAVVVFEREQSRAAVADRKREQSRAWRAANPDRYRELLRAWKIANPEKVRASKRGRKLEKRRSIVDYLLKQQNGRCAYCRATLVDNKHHLDHVMPLALGGPDSRRNLQLTCAACNLSKGPKHPIEYARQIGRLI